MAAKSSNQDVNALPPLPPLNQEHRRMPELPQLRDGFGLVKLYTPGQFNLSLNDTLDPTALGANEWSEITNVRLNEGVLRVRYGPSQILAGSGLNTLASRVADVANSSFVGGMYHRRSGIALIALSSSSAVSTRILWYSPSNDGWYEATATSGEFGNTRWGVAGHHVYFEAVHESHFIGTFPFSSVDDHDYVVCQIGQAGTYPIVFPLVDDGMALNGRAAFHKPIVSPNASTCFYQVYPWAAWNVSGGGLSYTASANTTSASHSAQNAAIWNAEFTSSAVATNGVSATGFTAVDVSQSNQIHILYSVEGALIDVWDALKISLYDSTASAWVVIYDPTSSDPAKRNAPVFIPAGTYSHTTTSDEADAYMLSLNTINKDIVAGHVFTGINISYVASVSPSQDFSIRVLFIAFAKGRRGGAEFAVSYFNSTARSESQAVVCRRAESGSIASIGGGALTGVYYPEDPSCFYTYRVSSTQPAIATLSKGDNYQLVYCKDFGEDDFMLVSGVDTQEIQVYSAGWALPTGLTSPEVAAPTAGDTRVRVISDQGVVCRAAPIDMHTTIPCGGAMVSANGRLFVSNVFWDASSLHGRGVAVSDGFNPFRFSLQTRVLNSGYVDPQSPVWLSMNGYEPMALATIAGGFFDSDSVVILTDRGMWACGGSDARQISRPELVSRHGTRSPLSMATYQNQVIWLDDELQIRTYGTSAPSLSKNRVERSLKAIPSAYVGNAVGYLSSDRYIIAYTPSGGTANTECLIYDFRTKAWSRDTRSGEARPVGFFQVLVSGRPVHASVSSTAKIYEYEADGVTTDLGSDIPVALSPTMVRDGLWNTVVVSQVGIVADKSAGKTLTISRTPKYSTTVPANTSMSIAGSSGSNIVWLWDNTPATFDASVKVLEGTSDVGVQVRVAGNLLGGTRIYAIVAQVAVIDNGASSNE